MVINYIMKMDFNEELELFTHIKIEETLPAPTPFYVVFVNNSNKCFLGFVEEFGESKVCRVVSNVTKLENIVKDFERYLTEEKSFIEININDIKQIEINIRSLKEILEIIPLWESENFLFRGQANREWEIESSLFRKGYRKQRESNLYSEIRQLNHELFNKNDFIELSCDMQHYGIPTRLVDWTGNIFNALYFACVSGEENQKKDAVVFAINNPETVDFNSDVYKEISAYIEYRYECKLTFEEGLIPIYSRIYESDKNYFFIKTRFYNERIKRQNGFFSICFETDEKEALDFYKYKIEDYLNRNHPFLSVDQVEKLKEEIKFPFDEGQIAKFYESIANYNSFAKNTEEIHMPSLREALERFKNIKPIEHCMNQIQIQEQHIKIIIPSVYKSTIIKDLDKLGINSSTIYPDLEGMTKYMREKYTN
jgi:hypothetical protein